jgi:phenylpyruvate tautomerase PptA (4-oxalocrotonate tautomerase family)
VAIEGDMLQVLVTVRFGVEAATAELLRRRLTESLTRQLGSAPPTVNVHIVDVHPD